MRSSITAAAVAAIAVLWAPLSGCSSDDESDTIGALSISVTTTGELPDPDGYTITINDRPSQAIGVNGTLEVTSLAEGSYTVTLTGMAEQCFSSGDDPVVIAVVGGATRGVHFDVSCPAGGSKVAVKVIVTGADPDTNGYLLKIGTSVPRRLPPTDTLTTLPSGALGTLPLVLSDIAANCTADPTNPTSVTVVAGQTAQVTLKFSCTPITGAIRIAITASGSDVPDAGYLLVMDADDTVSTSDSIAVVEHLSPGAHTVGIVQQAKYTDVGLQLNCSVSGGNPHNVTVAVGATADLPLAVTCAPLPLLTATVTTSGNVTDFDGYELTLTGPNAALTHVLAIPVNGSATPVKMLNGSYVATVNGIKGNCWLVGTERRPVAVAANMSLPLAVHCDPAHQIAVVRGVRSGAEIGIITTDGAYSRLTSNAVADSNPAWSPDGNRIAYASALTGGGDIYVMDANGGNIQLLFTSPAEEYQPAWSPDGSRIAFVSEKDGAPDIYLMNADGSNIVRLTAGAGSNTEPAWLPNGSGLAFVSTRTGVPGVYRMNPDGSGVTLLGTQAVSPSWSPAGDQLVAIPTAKNPGNAPKATDLLALELLSPSGSVLAAHKASISGKSVGHPAWGPDGRIAYRSAGTCPTTQCSLLTAINADGTGRNFISTAFTNVTEPAWRP